MTVHHAFVANQLVHLYMILDPLLGIRGTDEVYAKRHAKL